MVFLLKTIEVYASLSTNEMNIEIVFSI